MGKKKALVMFGNYSNNWLQNKLNITYNNKNQLLLIAVLKGLGVSAKISVIIVMFL